MSPLTGLGRAPRLEPDEEDALAALRHDAVRVDDLRIDLVAEMTFQRFHDDREGPPFIMPDEVLHVLQHERRRLVVVEEKTHRAPARSKASRNPPMPQKRSMKRSWPERPPSPPSARYHVSTVPTFFITRWPPPS